MNSELLQSLDKLMPSLEALFDAIAARTSDGVGISRDAYGEVRRRQPTFSSNTRAARVWMPTMIASEMSMSRQRDSSNRVRTFLIGSHVDSVPRGGNYDGLAGVIAGIGVLSSLQKAGALPRHNVRVLGFRGEESPWFGTAYLGSKLFTGQLSRSDAERLHRFDTGKPLAEHMTGIGVRLSDIGTGPAIPLDRVRAYLELHIEQGPVLEAIGRPIGIVTAIRGNIRHPFAKCFGRYAHSAAVPRHLRSDALMATVKLIAHADERWRTLIEAGHDDLVFTCGIFHTDPAEHAMTKVPGEVTFSFNVGSISDEAMDDMHRSVMARADHLAREHNVRFEFGERVGTPAVALNQDIAAILQRSGENLGIPIHRMPTVGHDAAMFARMGIPTCVILVRNANGSHNPAEHMEMDDFGLAVRIWHRAWPRSQQRTFDVDRRAQPPVAKQSWSVDVSQAEGNLTIDVALASTRERYVKSNPKSKAAHEKAKKVFPGGNTRSVLHFDPFPLTMERGEGAELWDIDGHRYFDFVGEFSAGLYGHTDPTIQAAIVEALESGVVLAAPTALEEKLASALSARFPSLQRLRFCNSGTEANILAIVTAIAVTGRSKILAFREAYHGGVLVFSGGGSPTNVPFDVDLADYNDVEGATALIRKASKAACCRYRRTHPRRRGQYPGQCGVSSRLEDGIRSRRRAADLRRGEDVAMRAGGDPGRVRYHARPYHARKVHRRGIAERRLRRPQGHYGPLRSDTHQWLSARRYFQQQCLLDGSRSCRADAGFHAGACGRFPEDSRGIPGRAQRLHGRA